eukprot:1615248-Rhodomonas_salina.2
MLILDGLGWDDRQDFIPRAEFQKHKDVIVPLPVAVKLASRSSETALVQVKSHTGMGHGVALNEDADVEA